MNRRNTTLRQAAFALLASSLFALSACGGGSGDQAPAATSSTDPSAGSSAAPTADATSWTECAAEYQTCEFSGTRKVKYGTATNSVEGTYTDSVPCGNAVFGDPAVGATKVCWVADAAATTSTSPSASTSGDASSVVATPSTGTGGSSSTAPTYVGAVGPGFVAGAYATSTPIAIDFGAALNGAQGYDVQLYRAGVAIAGGSASNVSSFSYTPVSQDSGQIISATVVARNSVGASETRYIPGILLN